MSKRDAKRTSHYSLQSQNWSLDTNPHKSTKKAKAKERQEGKKEIRQEIEKTDYIEPLEPEVEAALAEHQRKVLQKAMFEET